MLYITPKTPHDHTYPKLWEMRVRGPFFTETFSGNFFSGFFLYLVWFASILHYDIKINEHIFVVSSKNVSIGGSRFIIIAEFVYFCASIARLCTRVFIIFLGGTNTHCNLKSHWVTVRSLVNLARDVQSVSRYRTVSIITMKTNVIIVSLIIFHQLILSVQSLQDRSEHQSRANSSNPTETYRYAIKKFKVPVSTL